MNRGIMGWEADVVDWNTLTIEVAIVFDVRVNNAPFIDDSIDDAYTTEWVASGNVTKTYTFTREEFVRIYGPDVYAAITANSWQVARGLAPIGGTTPPFFRNVYADVFTNGFEDESEAWSVDWELNYVKVGPDTGATIPTSDSGTEGCFVRMACQPVFSGTNVEWNITISAVDSGGTPIGSTLLPEGEQDQGGLNKRVTLPGALFVENGPAIKVHNLHTVSGDLVDFGVTLNTTGTAAGDGWDGNYTVSTFTKTIDVVVTCSV